MFNRFITLAEYEPDVRELPLLGALRDWSDAEAALTVLDFSYFRPQIRSTEHGELEITRIACSINDLADVASDSRSQLMMLPTSSWLFGERRGTRTLGDVLDRLPLYACIYGGADPYFMLRRVAVLTDLTPRTTPIIRAAVDLAVARGAVVTLVHGVRCQAEEEAFAAFGKWMADEAHQRTSDHGRPHFELEIAPSRDCADMLQLVHDIDADLLVLGSSDWPRHCPPAHLDCRRVVAEAEMPVLVGRIAAQH